MAMVSGTESSKMKKEIRDGKVGVIYKPTYGYGWYSWHKVEELLYDPSLIYMLEELKKSTTNNSFMDWLDNIEDYLKDYPNKEFKYLGGAEELEIKWIPIGTLFRISEFDGMETVVLQNEDDWLIT